MEELFRRHWRGAHRAAYLVVHDGPAAEDIAQEAFISAIRSLDRFDRRRPFAPWLHRIVVNRAIDWTRARKARREVSGEAIEAWEDESHEPDLDAIADSGRMVAALRSLGPEQRAVVVMRYILEYTPGEIADILGMPRGTVNSRLRRGLDALCPIRSPGRPAMSERKRTEERVRSALHELEAPGRAARRGARPADGRSGVRRP